MHYNEFFTMGARAIAFLESVLSILFWILLTFGFDAPYIGVLTLLCALVHEMGHEICLIRLKGAPGKIRGRAIGFGIKGDCTLTTNEKIKLLSAGIRWNMCLALFLLPFAIGGSGYALDFAILNLATAISNALPVKGYDGYGIIRVLLDSRCTTALPYRVLDWSSWVICFLLVGFALYMMERWGEGYWIFAVFFIPLISPPLSELKSQIGSIEENK